MTDCICPTHMHLDKDGYPRIKHNKRFWRLNRLIWTFSFGDIPEGMVIGHRCNNSGCININHLYMTTAAENSTDASRDGLYRTGDSHPKMRYTLEIAQSMSNMYHIDGLTQQRIAEIFSTTQSRVSEVIQRFNR